MFKNIKGIHHITSIVGDPQENVDFYAGVLGLRLIKQTVNFDDPETYHLYFGNDIASPGTAITFFPWPGAYQGVIGDGQVGITSYAVPKGALGFWEKRLEGFNIDYTKTKRFGEEYLQFKDVHGLNLELVEREEGRENQWSFGGVTKEVAIKGFAGATLFSSAPDKTSELLEKDMGLKRIGAEGEFIRFKAQGETANIIDLKAEPGIRGRQGVGTVHHIAWSTADDNEQLQWKDLLEASGYGVTPVQDRNYFNSIYFREKGHILFEIATEGPGFDIDESMEALGENLKLPVQYEPYRSRIEQNLLPIKVRELK